MGDRFADFCEFGDGPDFRNAGVQRGHPLKGLAGDTVPLQIAEIGDLVDEDVGIVSEADQVISDSGHREHYRAVRGPHRVS